MYVHVVKRIMDVSMALMSLILLLVPIIIIALITIKDSKGPAFFSQQRSGKHRTKFRIYKFRSMPCTVSPNIPSNELDSLHLTKWQRWIRRSSLDELPQLYNILIGDMSFVGPRPVICEEQSLIDERDKYGANDVLPGLTGWAQVNGRDTLDYVTKARLDGEYVRHISFWWDMKCLYLTFFSVLKQQDIIH